MLKPHENRCGQMKDTIDFFTKEIALKNWIVLTKFCG